MKSTGTTPRRSTIHSWQGGLPAKQALLDRIQNITRELESIQTEMHAQLTETSAQTKISKIFENTAAVQVLHNFKAELDQLRRILWFYIEHAKGAAPCIDAEQQGPQMQHVAELLRVLMPAATGAENISEEGSGSFFERLDVVMDTYMQPKKPDTTAPKTTKNTGN